MRLHRLAYSPYARKVQILLELMGMTHEVVDVPYGDRQELARLTGGYILVPVLELDDGRALVDSRVICEWLVAQPQGERFVPPGLEAAAWGYHDFADGPLEDVLFRIASPATRDQWTSPFERALYVLVKERKFGVGCVDEWLRDRPTLLTRAQRLLAPSLRTLASSPFLLGEQVTLADAALYGQCAMLEAASPELLVAVAPSLVSYMHRVEARRPSRG